MGKKFTQDQYELLLKPWNKFLALANVVNP